MSLGEMFILALSMCQALSGFLFWLLSGIELGPHRGHWDGKTDVHAHPLPGHPAGTVPGLTFSCPNSFSPLMALRRGRILGGGVLALEGQRGKGHRGAPVTWMLRCLGPRPARTAPRTGISLTPSGSRSDSAASPAPRCTTDSHLTPCLRLLIWKLLGHRYRQDPSSHLPPPQNLRETEETGESQATRTPNPRDGQPSSFPPSVLGHSCSLAQTRLFRTKGNALARVRGGD